MKRCRGSARHVVEGLSQIGTPNQVATDALRFGGGVMEAGSPMAALGFSRRTLEDATAHVLSRLAAEAERRCAIK